MNDESAFNRSLHKRNPLRFPRDPIAPKATPEREAYDLGVDARRDFKSLDENPYKHDTKDHRKWSDHVDWATGWADEDRALHEDYDRKLDEDSGWED